MKFKQSEIIKEGWLKLCPSPQKSALIPNFLKNPLYGVKSQKSIPNDEAFYFRFSGKNIFYTYSETDMKVLGAIAVQKVHPVQDFYLRRNCFEVSSEREKWMLCGCSARKENWIEVISNPRTITLNLTINESSKTPEPQNRSNLSTLPEPIIQTTQIVKQPILLIPLPSGDCSRGWDYTSHGLDWQCRCKEGFEQSPIDLKTDCAISQKSILSPRFEYSRVAKENVKWVYEDHRLKLKGVRHNVELGRIYDYEGNIYQAYEIQFHTPSEHRINGKSFDLEVQVIHRTIAGEFKNKAVLSLLYQKEPGAKIPFFQGVDMVNLPNPMIRRSPEAMLKDFSIYDLMEEDMILPPSAVFSFFKYRGSMTSPPCEENVVWFVASDVISIGSTTLEILRDSLKPPKVTITNNYEIPDEDQVCFFKKTILDGNYRELQAVNQREVYFFDRKKNCLHGLHLRRDPPGHYEKLTRHFHEYFWVPNRKPSGVPDSYVVSDEEVPFEDRNVERDSEDERWVNKKPVNAIENRNLLNEEEKVMIK